MPQPVPVPQPQPQPSPTPPQTDQEQPTASSKSLKVYSAYYDHRTRTLRLDVETDEQEYVTVTCWYKVYEDQGLTREKTSHGAIFWEGPVKGRTTITISNVPATYVNHGVSVEIRKSGAGGEYEAVKDSVTIGADSIRGLSDYYSARAEALSKARWKYERVIPLGFGFARGGYVAVHSVSVDQNTRTVTVDIEVDGSTRRGDIASVWFGGQNWIRWSTGLGRSKVTMNWSDRWNELLTHGLYVVLRDSSGTIVGEIVLRPEELGVTAGTIVQQQVQQQAQLMMKCYSWEGAEVLVDPKHGSCEKVGLFSSPPQKAVIDARIRQLFPNLEVGYMNITNLEIWITKPRVIYEKRRIDPLTGKETVEYTMDGIIRLHRISYDAVPTVAKHYNYIKSVTTRTVEGGRFQTVYMEFPSVGEAKKFIDEMLGHKVQGDLWTGNIVRVDWVKSSGYKGWSDENPKDIAYGGF